MPAMIKIGNNELILAAGAAALLLYFYSESKKAAGAIADKAKAGVGYVADKANPLSSGNILNAGIIEPIGQAVTTNNNWTLGGQVADWFEPDHSNDPAYQSGKLTVTPVRVAGAKK